MLDLTLLGLLLTLMSIIENIEFLGMICHRLSWHRSIFLILKASSHRSLMLEHPLGIETIFDFDLLNLFVSFCIDQYICWRWFTFLAIGGVKLCLVESFLLILAKGLECPWLIIRFLEQIFRLAFLDHVKVFLLLFLFDNLIKILHYINVNLILLHSNLTK